MKIIVSHDVDHLSVLEHYKDFFIPKFVVRTSLKYLKGFISWKELRGRICGLVSNKLHNLEELIQFDKEYEIPSTFFLGVENGLGLSYSLKNAQKWIYYIKENGFDVGVHGIHFNNLAKINQEKKRFEQIAQARKFGVRMHYLRRSERTEEYLSKSGYLFDASEYALKNPYKIGEMWEFPLHVMDVDLITLKNLQSAGLQDIKEKTINIYNKAVRLQIKYFSILFHDIYYSDNYSLWKAWYEWFINWGISQDMEFISFREAIKKLD